MEKISVLPIVKRVIKSRNVNGADIARALNMHPTSVNGMLHRPTLQVQKLADLSDFLQYNFFRELATKFPGAGFPRIFSLFYEKGPSRKPVRNIQLNVMVHIESRKQKKPRLRDF
nr:hypothetical protein [uncultured Draconibacterium sp.]